MVKISEAFELYRLDYIVYNGQSISVEENHKAAFRRLIDFLGDIPIAILTFEMVRDWRGRLSKDLQQNTVREYVIRLRVVLRHLRRRGYEVMDYSAVTVPRRVKKIAAFHTPDEIEELLDVVFAPRKGYARINRYRNRAVVSFLYASGVRAAELLALDRMDLQADLSFTVFGKGGKPRLCFIDQRTKVFLDQYYALRDDNSPALFAAGDNRFSASALQRLFSFIRSKDVVAGKKGTHAHTMRHSFATDLLRNRANIRSVQELLGHESIETTQLYTHVVNEDLREAYLLSHSV